MDSNVFYPFLNKSFVTAVKGEGIYIYDSEGKRYIDGSSGAMTANLGHGLREVTGRIKNQMDTLSFTYRTQFTNLPVEELSIKIASLAPKPLSKVHYVNSGSEATESAMKLAKSYWNELGKVGKQMIISRWGSYHGSTMGSLSMSGNIGRRQSYHSYIELYPQLETPFCFHCPYEKEYPQCSLFCARELDRVISRIGENNISAFIAEPIVGASGAGITPPDDYFPLIKEICEKHNILFIMDEVITGFGRTGENFACNHWGVVPDIMVFGKGVSAGYAPLAGIIAHERIYNEIAMGSGEFSTGHTFGGNPFSCSAGCSVVDYMMEHDIVAQVRDKGSYLMAELKKLKDRSVLIADIRGKGLLIGVEIVRRKEGCISFERREKITEKLVEICYSKGLIVYPSGGMINGTLGDSILIAPPLTISIEEINNMVNILDDSIMELERSITNRE